MTLSHGRFLIIYCFTLNFVIVLSMYALNCIVFDCHFVAAFCIPTLRFNLTLQEILGRLLAMLFQWFDATAYLPDGNNCCLFFSLSQMSIGNRPLLHFLFDILYHYNTVFLLHAISPKARST